MPKEGWWREGKEKRVGSGGVSECILEKGLRRGYLAWCSRPG